MKKRFFYMALIFTSVIIVSVLYLKVALGSRGYDPYSQEIKQFEEDLQNPTLSELERQNIETKLDTVQYEATHWASGRESPAPRGVESNPPVSTPVAHKIPDGIDNTYLIPRPIPGFDKTVNISNVWRRTTPSRFYLVVAGYLITDIQQGMVLDWNANNHQFHLHLTPRKSGSVKIVKDAWPYLILESADGDIFYFDPVSERFVASLDEPTIPAAPTCGAPPDPSSCLTVTPKANPYP
ncbi:MAG: hypothetical protein AB1894_27890 [Chloroflexota bacterium]